MLAGLTACESEQTRAIRETSRNVEDITGARARVVWVQDTEEMNDVFARGDQLRLMGYDSRDGRGERPLLAERGHYMKPLLTPTGTRVVYSDTRVNRTFILNWDGKGHRVLTEGLALATWRDPEDGTEWIYVGREVHDERGLTFHRIVRMPVNEPSADETIWTRTRIQMDNFQVSANGRRAGALFPWPDAGVAHLPDHRMERVARGCWTSMAPDNSYVMWAFDGSHRTLLMADTRNDTDWQINISQADGIDGHEVYHPRWSNHPRYLAMSGPYKIRVGGNNIRGGGPDVEIFIGRFAADLKSIEAWVRVSDNPYANFFPDVWIDPGEHPPASAESANDKRAQETTPTIQPANGAWPAVRDGLVFLWTHRDADNEIATDEGRVVRSEAVPVGRARFGRHLDMDLRHGHFEAPIPNRDTPETPLAPDGLTIEATITPDARSDDGGVVIAMGVPGTNDAISLRASGPALSLVYNDSRIPLGSWPAEGTRHVALRVERERASLFIEGEPAGTETISPPLEQIRIAGPLSFGGKPNGAANWSGYMEGVALYTRVLADDEVRRNAEAYAARIRDRKPPPDAVTVRALLTHASQIPSPEAIEPYPRGLVANEYEVLEVIEGELEDTHILVAHWVILDGETLNTARREEGDLFTMTLEPYDDRPDLEGERLSMDSDNILLRTFFDTGS